MKKNFLRIIVAITTTLSLLAACGGNATSNTQTTTANSNETKVEANAGETKQSETKYKDTILPYDQLVQGRKIVFLQNALVYTRDGFYTEATAPKTEKINYNGAQVDAYPISYVTKHLLKGIKRNIDVFMTNGDDDVVDPNDFNGMYVILGDLTSGKAPILYNPVTENEIVDFKYADTGYDEYIYSIVSEEEVKIADLINTVGWDATKTYRLMATDYFYVPVDPANAKTGMLLGTLSGAINANLPDITFMKSGKINDIMYLEQLTDVVSEAK